jgi:hypothetical protein
MGRCAFGSYHRILFIPGRIDAVGICREELFDPVAGLLDVLYYENKRGPVVVLGHNL